MASVLATPLITEQLPPYTSDPETSSVSSRAPSYVSAAPAYDHLISAPAAPSPCGERNVNEHGNGVSMLNSATANTSTTITSTVSSLTGPSCSSAASSTSVRTSALSLQSTTPISSHLSNPGHSFQHHQKGRPARTGGLPNHPYAEGFVPRLPGSIPSPACFDGSIFSSRRPNNVKAHQNGGSCSNDWPSTRNSHAARQYHAVAKRRAREGRDSGEQSNNGNINISGSGGSGACGASGSTGIPGCTDAAAGSAKGVSGAGGGALSALASSGSAAARAGENVVNPLEDPYLVGEEAAKRAREARIYREMCAREAEDMKCEGKVGG